MLYCSVNGKQCDHISVSDRGFSYGDGIFTTAKIENGRVLMLTAHLSRLSKGSEKLNISFPNIKTLSDEIKKIALEFPLAVLKVVLTSGQGGRGYSRLGSSPANIVISVHEFPKNYHKLSRQGIVLGDSKLKLGLNPMLSGLKHLNRLEQVLIREELDKRQEDDLLVCDINNNIVETSSANVFWIKEHTIYTSKITSAGVSGLMRDVILNNIKNVQTVEAKLEDINDISSMFICNSVMGIVPVRRYNTRDLSIEAIVAIQNRVNLDISE